MSGEALAAEVEEALSVRVRPLLKSHGGSIAVREINERGVVKLDWLGACTGCPLRPMTTAGLIEPELTAIEGVSAVDTGARVSRHAAARLARVSGQAALRRPVSARGHTGGGKG